MQASLSGFDAIHRLEDEDASMRTVHFMAFDSDAGMPRPDTVSDIGQLRPAVQTQFGNPEVLGDLRQRRLALAGRVDYVTAELFMERLGAR